MGCLTTDDVDKSLTNFMQVNTFVVFSDVHKFTVQRVITWRGCDKMSVSINFSF